VQSSTYVIGEQFLM